MSGLAPDRQRWVTLAPAKVNLSLCVVGRRADGYHDLVSMVAFTRFGDELALTPADETRLTVRGPFRHQTGPDASNLIIRAVGSLRERVPQLRSGHFYLFKRLPAAAGLGGGSSDAAAALRLLARLNALALSDERVRQAAAAVGADVPVCLEALPRVMRGVGGDLGAPLSLPPIPILLVNPGVRLETRPVFVAMGLQPGQNHQGSAAPLHDLPEQLPQIWQALADAGNDMEPAAITLAPVVGALLQQLRLQSGVRLARMSGSGATCFALFDSCAHLRGAAKAMRQQFAHYWVSPGVLAPLSKHRF